MIDSQIVAAAHDAMEKDYDEINDLWYAHLYNEIHHFIIKRLQPGHGLKALDVGCGTGFQSILLAYAGYEVKGFDLAEKLVAIAKIKAESLSSVNRGITPLYQTTLQPFSQDQGEIIRQADTLRGRYPINIPSFSVGDAMNPQEYESAAYDVIICCGSVLSFIEAHDSIIKLMTNSLKRGGHLFLEVEQKCNLDLLWPFIDLLTRGRLHYEQTLREIVSNLFSKHGENLYIDYPFLLSNGTNIQLPLYLFSVNYLEKLFDNVGLNIIDKRGIHVLTNLIPSTILHHQNPNKRIFMLFSVLSGMDKIMSGCWPFWRLGCSVIYCLQKPQHFKDGKYRDI